MNGSSAQIAEVGSWLQATVVSRKILAEGVLGLVLQSANENELPPFTAGSHVDLKLPNGVIRQYSLCNDPVERNRYELGIMLVADGGGGSRAAHNNVHAGDVVLVRAPRNLFRLKPAKQSLLLAGGIGITPILAMAAQLHREGGDFVMHYCARAQNRMAYFQRLQESPFANRVKFHFDDGGPLQHFNAASVLAEPHPEKHLYVCGPQGFMDAVIKTAQAQGWSSENIHFEYFSAPVTDNKVESGSFEVCLASSGKVVMVSPEQSIAQALTDAGVTVPLSCEQGICGTCLVRVLEGEPDHRDMYLSEAEKAANNQMTLCCSRSRSRRLVLDL